MSDKCPGCKVEIIHHRVPDCPRCGTALPDPHAEIVSLRAENARLTELVARKQFWWDDVCAATKRAEAAEARVAALQEEVERKRVKLDERFDRIRALENEVETWRKLVKPLQESADRTVDVIVPALEAAEEKVAALEKQLHDTLARKGSDFSGMVRKIAAPTAVVELSEKETAAIAWAKGKQTEPCNCQDGTCSYATTLYKLVRRLMSGEAGS